MKFLAVVALVCMLAFAASMTDSEVKTAIDRMENSNYGKTLLSTIALQLSAEGPVEDLIRML
jgi:hypothetical protein